MVSNYPPGHPTGISVTQANFGFVWCESCGRTKERQSEVEPLPRCPECNGWMEPMLCQNCENEATVEVYERDTNAASFYCESCAR